MKRSMKPLISVCSLATCLVIFSGSTSLGAALSAAGPVLVPFTASGLPPAQARAPLGDFAAGPWTGTWSAPALPAWVGTFDATGPLPAGTTAGTTDYDFTTTHPTGFLPIGTYFQFGDVDFGSGTNEKFQLRAFVSSIQISGAWLDETIGISGAGGPTDMPDYSFASGVYTFDGTGVPGNPGVVFYLPSNTAITQLEVIRFSSNENFALWAPVPEPSSLILLCCGAACAAGSLLVRGVKRRNRRAQRTATLT